VYGDKGWLVLRIWILFSFSYPHPPLPPPSNKNLGSTVVDSSSWGHFASVIFYTWLLPHHISYTLPHNTFQHYSTQKWTALSSELWTCPRKEGMNSNGPFLFIINFQPFPQPFHCPLIFSPNSGMRTQEDHLKSMKSIHSKYLTVIRSFLTGRQWMGSRNVACSNTLRGFHWMPQLQVRVLQQLAVFYADLF
jgi:hypothetical protein